MIQFLNNIWIALTTENIKLINFLIFPVGLIEAYLIMTLFLTIFNVHTNRKQKFFYIIFVFLTSTISLNFIPAPYNVFLNYGCMLFLINRIFNLNLLKSFMSLIFSTAIFGLINTLSIS